MTEVNITAGSFKYSTITYFRGKAENVEMGSYGQKKTPFAAPAYLSIQNKVKTEYLHGRVRFVTRTAVDWTKETSADVSAFVYFSAGVTTAVTGSYDKAKSAKLELIKFAIDEGPLKTMLNTDASGARNFLRDEGSDGRIVTEIWVVVEAKLAEHFQTSTSISVADVAGTAKVTATGGVQGTQSITISKGTTFAYLMYSVKKWNSDKTRIEDLEDDQVGMT